MTKQQAGRVELIEAAPLIPGALYARHIEEPKEVFRIAVLRSPCFNVIYRPERWESWSVMAETPEGAMKVAQYHFFLSHDFECLGKTDAM
jgi:hypothetical protein